MRSLEEFDKDAIPDAVVRKLQRYVNDPAYTPGADEKGRKPRRVHMLCAAVCCVCAANCPSDPSLRCVKQRPSASRARPR